jgi:hypothetical protein
MIFFGMQIYSVSKNEMCILDYIGAHLCARARALSLSHHLHTDSCTHTHTLTHALTSRHTHSERERERERDCTSGRAHTHIHILRQTVSQADRHTGPRRYKRAQAHEINYVFLAMPVALHLRRARARFS